MQKRTYNILHISDSHQFHGFYKIPKKTDILIFSGDCSNYKDPFRNLSEVENFFYWFSKLRVKHKVFVAGNHDTSIEKGLFPKTKFKEAGIHYLQDDYVVIEGLKIYGSPRTPQFCDWAFMHDRSKIHKFWDNIPEDVDVLITHGPPKGILDLSMDFDNSYKLCGCSNLRKRIKQLSQLQLMCFGHIHNGHGIENAGVTYIDNVLFSNATGVEDGKWEKGLTYQGNKFKYDKKTKQIKIA